MSVVRLPIQADAFALGVQDGVYDIPGVGPTASSCPLETSRAPTSNSMWASIILIEVLMTIVNCKGYP